MEFVKMPPLGILSQWRWKELNPNPTEQDYIDRITEIQKARIRYIEAGKDIPDEWLKEIHDILSK